jgi:hypothetical protein
MARTAVVAGTATAVAGGVARHQQGKAQDAAEEQQYEMAQQQAAIDASVAQQLAAQQPPPAYAPPAAAPPAPDPIEQLKELAALKEAGVLTQAEFDAQKARVLNG